ncbi:hypothetical protein AXK58_21665 [Tsukamurella tyrosinosolvens]|nr:hypothetical protein AXK58_21665 [Tsukamurella tyrosinosolvens]
MNGPFAAAGAPAHYRCPNGHDHGDLAGWEKDSGRMHGLQDALEAEVNPSHRRVLDTRIANARRGTPGGDAYLSAVGTILGAGTRKDPAA